MDQKTNMRKSIPNTTPRVPPQLKHNRQGMRIDEDASERPIEVPIALAWVELESTSGGKWWGLVRP